MTSRRSSGSIRPDSAVEPTKSENMTVTWRRSARSSGRALGALEVVAASTEVGLPFASLRRAAIASRSLRRCPTAVTPSSLRVSCVRLRRTASSISFSRNAARYFSRNEKRTDQDYGGNRRALRRIVRDVRKASNTNAYALMEERAHASATHTGNGGARAPSFTANTKICHPERT